MLDFWNWLNGKKTALGAVIDLLYSGVGALIVWLPQIGDALNALGPFGAWAAGAVLILGKVLMILGIVHKFFKGF